MGNREDLLKERERIKELEEIMKREAEEVFKDFKLRYEYKVKKDIEEHHRVFYRGDEIGTFIRIDIRPSPGIGHELAGLNLKARKIAPYVHLDIPALFTVWQIFLATTDGTIIPYSQSFVEYDFRLTERFIFVLPLMNIYMSSLKEGEGDKIEIYAKKMKERILKIEKWIKDGYPNNELIWEEEIERVVIKQ